MPKKAKGKRVTFYVKTKGGKKKKVTFTAKG